jgi:hypothetical protein
VHGWYTVSVALVNVTSVMASVHWEFGQSGAVYTPVWPQSNQAQEVVLPLRFPLELIAWESDPVPRSRRVHENPARPEPLNAVR